MLYLAGNGDAHLKNFSLLENAFGDHSVSPGYDLLCTTVHLPNDTRTALELFDSDFETESFKLNGFYTRPDFLELATRYGMIKKRAEKILDRFASAGPRTEELIDRSLLSEEAKTRFRKTFRDRMTTV